MNITDVRIRKVFPTGKLKAIVSVTFDDSFVVHDIKIIEGQNGQFVAMPNRKTIRGEYKDICHPITKESREYLEDAVLSAYSTYMDNNDIEESFIETEEVFEEPIE